MKKSISIIVVVAILGIISVFLVTADDEAKNIKVAANSQTTNAVSGTSNNASSSTTASQSTLKNGTFRGQASSTPFGDVQVSIVITDGKISDVNFISLPINDSRSKAISDQVSPQLKQVTLDKQSANIDTISGATYTSQSYINSLQSAIDQAVI